MKVKYFLFALLVAFFWASAPAMADTKYVGVETCKKCHNKTKTGKQYSVWKKAKHSEAFGVLATPKAQENAKKAGITVDNPQTDKKCLICHASLKYDENGNERPADLFKDKFSHEDGTQCEVCHGAGEKYAKSKVMKKIKKEGGIKKDSPTAKETGLLKPTEETCKRCHVQEITIGGVTYKNPSYQPFDFKERYDKIKHERPAGAGEDDNGEDDKEE